MELKDYGKIESTSIDYKEKVETKKPESWLKSVSAFANTNGGILLFGISDKDKIKVGLYDVIEIAKNLKIKSI
ncbi:MAG: ATP-binding protein [Acholeplasma sp.]|nr:ATP-binding protein [Acholeplasma sp.]